eukprot:696339-Amphidinium_carterae.1
MSSTTLLRDLPMPCVSSRTSVQRGRRLSFIMVVANEQPGSTPPHDENRGAGRLETIITLGRLYS